MSEEPLAVERIAHTAASPEGANSTYVVPDRGLVVDPGPPGDDSWETLTDGLAAVDLPTDAVETVVVSHWHADHSGLAPRLAAAADAELVLHEADAPLVADYAAERTRRVARDARRLREWGVPDETVEAIKAGDDPSPMPDQCPVRAVSDGDHVAGLEAFHTPGHTSGHLSLVAADALFLGDAVLPTYTPNVGGSDTRMNAALSVYLATLDRIESRARSVGVASDATGDISSDATGESSLRAFPGHGPSVDLLARIGVIREHHAERVREMVRALPDSGPGRTPWDVARDCFGEMTGIHAKMGAGEAAAHLSFAADRGLAVRDDDSSVRDSPVRYVAADADLSDPLVDRR